MSNPPGKTLPAAWSTPEQLRLRLADPSAAERSRALSELTDRGILDALGEALPEADRWMRLEIVRTLARTGTLDPLAAVLVDPDAEVRLETIRALALLPGGEADALLARFVADPDPVLRRRALRALVQREAHELPLALAQAVEDHDPAVRAAAARALSGLPDAQAVGVARLLADPEADLQSLARRRIAALTDPASLPLLVRAVVPLPDEARAEAVALTERLWSSLPIGSLVTLLPQSAALAALLRRDRPAEMDAAIARLLEGEEYLLGVQLHPRAGELARHPSARVRMAALPRIQTPALLLDLCRDPEPSIARAAAVALATQGCTDPSLTEAYRAILEDPRSPEGVRLRLVDLLAADPDLLAQTALGAPRVLQRKIAASLVRAGALDALAAMQDVDDPVALKSCAWALSDAGDPRALIPLARACGELRGPPARAAEARLARFPAAREPDFLLSALRHRRLSVRRWAAAGLADSADPRAIDPLLAAAAESEPELQEAAVGALAKFAPSRPDVVERLIGFLRYGDIAVRQAACEALGAQRIAAAVEPLAALLVNPFLGPRAERALKQIGERRGLLMIVRRRRRAENVANAGAWVRQRNEVREKMRKELHGKTR